MCGHTLSSYFSSCSKTRVLDAVARVSRPSSLSRWRSQACAMASLTYRKPIVLPPRAAHTATVIMLHGLGDSGEGWAFLGPEFSTALPHVKFIFPHAPSVGFAMQLQFSCSYSALLPPCMAHCC